MRWAAFAVALVLGCAGSTPYQVHRGELDPRLRPRHYVTIVHDFETAATCTSEDRVELTVLDEGLVHAAGCAAEAEYGFRCGARGGWNYTCWWFRLSDVHAQAEADFGCPADAVDVHIVEPRIREVRACGNAARYRLACDASELDESCRWIDDDEDAGGDGASHGLPSPPS